MEEQLKCNSCEKEYTTPRALTCHIWRVHTKEGKSHSIKVGKAASNSPNRFIPIGWNRGLTKETNASLRKMSETMLKKKHTYKHSDEMKRKLSKIVRKRIDDGKFIFSCGRAKKLYYQSKMAGKICVHGSWELKFAKWCDDNNIEFERNSNGFKYTFEGKQHTYFPDFKIGNDTTFVEVKGYQTEKDLAKWSQFPHKLIVLKRYQISNLQSFSKEDLQKHMLS